MMDDEAKKEVSGMIAEAIKSHRHDGVLTQVVYLDKIIDPVFGRYARKWSEMFALGETSIARPTNGTSPVSIFGAVNPYYFRLHAVVVISGDTTAGNIIVKNGSNTSATVAKGTTAALLFGATSLANTDFVPGTDCTIESSSAGNAVVILFLEFPDN